MTHDEFLSGLRAFVIDTNATYYDALYADFPPERASTPFLRGMVALYAELSPDQRAVLAEMYRKVAVEAVGNTLSLLDDGLPGQTAPFALRHGFKRLNGDPRDTRPTAVAARDHVFRHGRLCDLEAKFQQFPVNARRAPQGVFATHPPDEFEHIPPNPRPPPTPARLALPPESKGLAVQRDEPFGQSLYPFASRCEATDEAQNGGDQNPTHNQESGKSPARLGERRVIHSNIYTAPRLLRLVPLR